MTDGEKRIIDLANKMKIKLNVEGREPEVEKYAIHGICEFCKHPCPKYYSFRAVCYYMDKEQE